MDQNNSTTEYASVGRTFLLHRAIMSAATTCVWLEMQTFWWIDKKSKKRINPYVSCGQVELQYWTGIGESSVKKAIEELKILGFIEKIEYRFMDSCRYYLNADPDITSEKVKKLQRFQKSYSSKRNRKNKSQSQKVLEVIDDAEDEYWGEKPSQNSL